MDSVARVGQMAPDFALPDLDGAVYRLAEARGTIVVLVFWSADCPHSKRGDRLLAEARTGWGSRVAVWWLAPNPNEAVERLGAAARRSGVGPVLLDGRQRVARMYAARTTPHVYVIDGDGVLRYAGALDDVGWRRPTPSRNYVAEAVQALLTGAVPDPAETPPFGCALVHAGHADPSPD